MVQMDTREGGRGYSSNRGGGRGYYGSNRGGYSNQFTYQNNNNSYSNRGGGYWGGRGRRGRGRGYYSNANAPGGGSSSGGGRHNVLPNDVEFLSDLKGHKKKITCMCLDQDRGQLLTGSHDQTVRVWNCQTGECEATTQVGGEVDSMLMQGGFLFVGVKTTQGQGQIKVWNMSNMQHTVLEGHIGQVTALAAANGMLFSGGQDKTIRVWKMNPSTGNFECAAVLQQEQDGHRLSVSFMCVSEPFLFSGDTGGTIKVWDLEAGVIKQTLIKAHKNSQHPAIMSLLIWEGHLLSGSLDGDIKIWEPADPATGNVVNPTSIYVYPERDESHNQGRGRGRTYNRGPAANGVLSMCGVADLAGKAVLMVSYNTENSIRLFELPAFIDRGSLHHISNARAMTGFPPGNLMIGGDEHGKVKCWRWKAVA